MGPRLDRALFFILFYLTIPILSSSEKTVSFLSSTSTPLQSNPTPQYQPLPILQDDSGFYYIDVTWKNSSSNYYSFLSQGVSPSDFQDYPAINNGKMVLSLYTNTSFVSSCDNFLQYDCSLLDCQINNEKEIAAEYLNAGTEIEGYSIGVGMESSAFNMCGYSVIYASTCGMEFTPGISGYLGFGFALNAFFEVNRNFSIFLSNGNDGLNSTLLVGPDDDQDFIDSSTSFQQSWDTDENWMVNVIGASAQVENQPGSYRAALSMTNQYKALFDINTEAIGMPKDLFSNLTSMLEPYGVTCSASPYQPTCTYNGDVSSLPTFYFDLEKNQSAIEIKPQVYFVQNPDLSTSYTLMFAEVASGIPGALQVSPEYENSIILGSPFMTFYYVHFSLCEDYIQPYVTLYLANHDTASPSSDLAKILIISGACALFVLIVVAVACFIVKKRRKSRAQKIEDERATVDTFDIWNKRDIENLNKNNGSALKQPLVEHSNSSDEESNEDNEIKITQGKKKVWSNENIGYVDPDDISAYTYKKQKFRGLYESGAESFTGSLNNDTGVESH